MQDHRTPRGVLFMRTSHGSRQLRVTDARQSALGRANTLFSCDWIPYLG
jgi:hypothetical protein